MAVSHVGLTLTDASFEEHVERLRATIGHSIDDRAAPDPGDCVSIFSTTPGAQSIRSVRRSDYFAQAPTAASVPLPTSPIDDTPPVQVSHIASTAIGSNVPLPNSPMEAPAQSPAIQISESAIDRVYVQTPPADDTEKEYFEDHLPSEKSASDSWVRYESRSSDSQTYEEPRVRRTTKADRIVLALAFFAAVLIAGRLLRPHASSNSISTPITPILQPVVEPLSQVALAVRPVSALAAPRQRIIKQVKEIKAESVKPIKPSHRRTTTRKGQAASTTPSSPIASALPGRLIAALSVSALFVALLARSATSNRKGQPLKVVDGHVVPAPTPELPARRSSLRLATTPGAPIPPTRAFP